MQLQQTVKNVFVQLSESLTQLSDDQYVQPSKILFNATVGQHVRHIIELFICLEKGYETGLVNYEKRKRDLLIETSRHFANELLQRIYGALEKPNKKLLLESNYDEHTEEDITVTTNYYREIIYNLEHTVHHMALIRVGINEVSAITVPDGFGVASSTIKYRNRCAQ
ncbi:MAG: DinB family protein [Bacteroidetes bacterium]|nr:MAG: DinB family protein [Bacteroidota bacterium]